MVRLKRRRRRKTESPKKMSLARLGCDDDHDSDKACDGFLVVIRQDAGEHCNDDDDDGGGGDVDAADNMLG